MPKVAKQTSVYTSKNFRLYMNRKDWIMLPVAALITLLVCWIVSDKMFQNVESTVSGYFAIISAALWIGIFNSIQRICKEHATISSECRSGLHIRAYVLSHALFDIIPCFLQTLIITIISYIFIEFPTMGVLLPFVIEYFITIFLIVYASDLLGIAVSAIVPNTNTAMTVMPFVLIVQLLLCGVIFPISEDIEVISNPTLSKWGINALASMSDLNSPEIPSRATIELEKMLEDNDVPKSAMARMDIAEMTKNEKPQYECTVENLMLCWFAIIIIGVMSVVIAGLVLKLKNRK